MAIMVLPANVFPGALVHVPLLPNQRIQLLNLTYNKLHSLLQLFGCEPSEEHVSICPFMCHAPFLMIVCKAPVFGSFGTGCLLLVDAVCEFIFGNRRSCGNFKGRHVGGLGGMKDLFVLSSLSFHSTKHIIYTLFIHYLI